MQLVHLTIQLLKNDLLHAIASTLHNATLQKDSTIEVKRDTFDAPVAPYAEDCCSYFSMG